ncbi:MAG: acetate--CoA ligase family protein [Thermoplasmatota archaeon]
MEQPGTVLPEDQAKEMLQRYDIPTTEYAVVSSADEAAELDIAFPLVAKVCSPDILHKTDVGGVQLNIQSLEQLHDAVASLVEHFDAPVLVEHMEPSGVEMIAGLLNDPSFGLSIMAGMGGVFTELYNDVAFRLVPITRRDAEAMLDDLKASQLFEGFRDMHLDRNALIDMLLSLSTLGSDHPSLHQMDLNPVLVYEDGIRVVDAKVIIGE